MVDHLQKQFGLIGRVFMPWKNGIRSWHNQGCDHNIVKEKKVIVKWKLLKSFGKRKLETITITLSLKNNEEFIESW